MSNPQLVTKSVRLNHNEDQALAQISQAKGISEAALMKQFVLDGIARYRLEQAITAYRQGEVDLPAAARYAGVSIYRMMTEFEARDITPPAATEKFVQGLKTLVETFGGSVALHQTIGELESPRHEQ